MTFDAKTAIALLVLAGGWLWSLAHYADQIQRQEAGLAVLYADKDATRDWRAKADVRLGKIDELVRERDERNTALLKRCQGGQ